MTVHRKPRKPGKAFMGSSDRLALAAGVKPTPTPKKKPAKPAKASLVARVVKAITPKKKAKSKNA